MSWSLVFVVNSILLGVGLAMDAFSVSMANGLNEPEYEEEKDAGDCWDFRCISGVDADGRVDMCPYDCRILFSI